MRAGLLDQLITIEQYSESANSIGQITKSWSTYKQVRATRTDISGREYFAAESVQSEVTTKFFIRRDTGVNPKMRILCGGKTYDIEAVIDHGRKKRMTEMLCTRSDDG